MCGLLPFNYADVRFVLPDTIVPLLEGSANGHEYNDDGRGLEGRDMHLMLEAAGQGAGGAGCGLDEMCVSTRLNYLNCCRTTAEHEHTYIRLSVLHVYIISYFKHFLNILCLLLSALLHTHFQL